MEKSFTIIEILIAVFILATAMLSIFAIFGLTIINTNASKNLTLANNLAQAKIEQTLSLAYDEIISIERTAHNDQFDWQINVQLMTIQSGELQESATDQGLKKITAIIYWQEKGQEKNKSLNTLKARY